MVTQKIHRLFFYLLIFQLLGPAGPVPEPERQAARHQLRKPKLAGSCESRPLSPCPDSCSHARLLHTAPGANPNSPFTPTTSVTSLLDWHILDEGARGNYVSRAFQTHNFSQTYGHMGKRTTCYLTALLDFASVYFQPSVVAPREFCTVHIFPQYGAKIIHFTLQRS